MTKKREGFYPPLTAREKTLLETAMLQSTANTLIVESCSADAVLQALHLVQWLKKHAKPGTSELFKPMLRAEESPRLLAATKYLVAVAKKYLVKVPRPEDWMYGYLVEKHGTRDANREVARRDRVYGKIMRDVKKLLARRKAQHASAPELSAIRTFIDALKRACDLYRPNHGPTSPQPGTFRSVDVPVSRDYPHHSGRN